MNSSQTAAPNLYSRWQGLKSRLWLPMDSADHLRASSPPDRRQVILWGLAMLIGLALILINFPKYQVGAHYDDAAYITLARSLLQDRGYGLINYPGEPRVWNYPFGYPLLLAPFAALQSSELNVFKFLSGLLTLTNAGLLFWGWKIFSRRLSYWWGLAISAMYLFSPVTIDLSGRVMAEPAFLTFYLLAMLTVEKAVNGRWKDGILRWVWPFGLGLFLSMTLYIRTIGIVMVAGIFLYLIFAMGKRSVLPFAAAILSMFLFTFCIVEVTQVTWEDLIPQKYLSDNQSALIVETSTIFIPASESQPPAGAEQAGGSNNLRTFIYNYLILGSEQLLKTTLRGAVFPFAGSDRELAFANQIGIPFLPSVIGIIFSVVILVGYGRWFYRERLTSFNFSGVIYLFSLLAWVWNSLRFLNPIQPQLLTAMLLGLQGVLSSLASIWKRLTHKDLRAYISPLLASAVVVILAMSIYKSVTLSDSRQHVGLLSERTAWLRQNAPLDGIILSEYPAVDYLYTDRSTLNYPSTTITAAELEAYISKNNVDYLLVAPRLFWKKPFYEPLYSKSMENLLPPIEQLSQENIITLVFSDTASLIHVYQVN